MRNRCIRGSLLAGAGVLASCHHGPGRPEAALVRQDGAYNYVARVNGKPYAGVLHVVSDTVLVEVHEGACYYDPASVSTTTIRYKCEGLQDVEDFVLVLDRHNPVGSSHWSATAYRNVQHRVCDAYSTAVNGRSACVSSHVEFENRKETITGTLTMKSPGP